MLLSVLAFLLSLGPLQYGQVNLLYYPATAQTADAPNPCVVDVAILNGGANPVKTQTVSLYPTGSNGPHSAAITFSRANVGGPGIFTVQTGIEDTCAQSPDPNCDASECNISESIEIVDSLTGDTRFVLSSPVRGRLARQE